MNSGVNAHPSIWIDSPVTTTTQLVLVPAIETLNKMYVKAKPIITKGK